MTKEEAIEKMKKFGYTDDEIMKIVSIHEKAIADGIKYPWDMLVVKYPIVDDD